MLSRRPVFALITGCSSGGIGEALAHEFLHRDIQPIATLLPSEPSEHLSRLGITWFPLDVTQEESIQKLKAKITALTGGHLDILVNNAGYTMPAIDTDVNAVRRMFEVNLFGPMRMIRHFHDHLIRSAGTVVNIGSIAGIVPYVYGASYNASKAGLIHWSNTLRVEMAPFDVKVLVIITGEVGTNILKNDHGRELPAGSYYSPLEVEFREHVHRAPVATDRFVFARQVVTQTLKHSPPVWFWTGSSAGLIRFLDACFPRGIFDCIFARMFNLGKLREAHAAKKLD